MHHSYQPISHISQSMCHWLQCWCNDWPMMAETWLNKPKLLT